MNHNDIVVDIIDKINTKKDYLENYSGSLNGDELEIIMEYIDFITDIRETLDSLVSSDDIDSKSNSDCEAEEPDEFQASDVDEGDYE